MMELSNRLAFLSLFQKDLYAVQQVNILPAFSQKSEQNLMRTCDIRQFFKNKLHCNFLLNLQQVQRNAGYLVLNFN